MNGLQNYLSFRIYIFKTNVFLIDKNTYFFIFVCENLQKSMSEKFEFIPEKKNNQKCLQSFVLSFLPFRS